MEKCIIVGAGDFYGIDHIPLGALIIAADGGYEHLNSLGLEPAVVLGDFDSSKSIPRHRNVIRFNPEKDETDMELALSYGMERGCGEFYIYGGTGGRFSHTVANIQCLAKIARQGCLGYLMGKNEFTLVASGRTAEFSRDASGYVSLFALSDEISGVWETGLKYSLEDAVLTNTTSLGASNQFTGSEARITVKTGVFAVISKLENINHISLPE